MTIPEHDFFKMYVFGYRTRFHRFMSRAHRVKDKKLWQELAAWIRERYSERDSNHLLPEAVRFVWAWTKVDAKNVPVGHWRKPLLESFPKKGTRVLFTRTFEKPEGPSSAAAAGKVGTE